MSRLPNEIGSNETVVIRCDVSRYTNGAIMLRFRPRTYGGPMAPKANFGFAITGLKRALGIGYRPCYDASKNRWIFPAAWNISIADLRRYLPEAFARESIELIVSVVAEDGPYSFDESLLT